MNVYKPTYFCLTVLLMILLSRHVNARSNGVTSGSQANNTGIEETVTGNENARIIGGDDAEKGKLYWQVSIQLKEDDFHFCGGSIVDPYWILTAAHCLNDVKASEIKVVAGEYDLDKDEGKEVSANARTLFIHEDYDQTGNSDNDIGLIHLESSLKLSSTVDTITLPEKKEAFIGSMCIVSGWGTRTSGRDQSYHILQEVEVPVVSDTVCQLGCTAEHPDCVIETTQLCAGFKTGGKDACQGDSGGPLACVIDDTTYLAGVVSTGYGCGEPNLYGIYTEVSYFNSWIDTTIANSAFSAKLTNHFSYTFLLTSVILVLKCLYTEF